jgi:thioredoxin-dependent peroxiredoxin
MSRLVVGKPVPDFSLPSTAGTEFSLRAARGKPLVLYFYPRDNTPGCTLEAQDFQRLLPSFRRAGVRVCGVSRDSMAAHQKFCSQHGLAFELLVDEAGTACKLFDVIHEKNMYGRKVLGIVRSTFLIDAAGALRQEWRKVKVAEHAAEVLEAAKAL